jgi:hypothetical protein
LSIKTDFRFFLAYVWKQLGLPKPTPIQNEIASFLQDGGRRIGVEAFRGVGKSWITSAFVCWLLYRDPEVKILVVSASKDRADSFSIFTKRLISDLPALQALTPDQNLGDRDSNVAFDVRGCKPHHAPSVKSVGITGQMTGSRADYIVLDDVEVVNNSETALQREKLLSRIAEAGGAILTPAAQQGKQGGVVFLGTPQVEDSIYGKLPERGYTFRIWPAEVPEKTEPYLGLLAPGIIEIGPPGTPTDPARFDKSELAERRLEYGRAGYSLQFQLDTTLSDLDRHPLKLSDFIVMDTDVDVAPDKAVWGSGEDQEHHGLALVGLPGDRFYKPMHVSDGFSPYTGSILYIDPSGRGKDETGYAVVKYLHGQLIIRAWGGMQGGYANEALTKLAKVAADEKVNEVLIEDNFGDGMFRELFIPVLRKVYKTKDGEGCIVEGDHVTGQKELRIIDSIEPALSAHRIILDLAVVKGDIRDRSGSHDPESGLKTNFYQLTRLTRDRGSLKYDDRIDALAGAIRYWTERMSADVREQEKESREARGEEYARLHQEGLLESVMKFPQHKPAAKRHNRPVRDHKRVRIQ